MAHYHLDNLLRILGPAGDLVPRVLFFVNSAGIHFLDRSAVELDWRLLGLVWNFFLNVFSRIGGLSLKLRLLLRLDR